MLISIVQTLNNESTIEDCIKSLIPLGPMFVFDSGSQDSTVSKAQALGATVVKNPGVGYKNGLIVHFSDMRNYSVRYIEENVKDATYALFVDSDDMCEQQGELPKLTELSYLIDYKMGALCWERTGVIRLRAGLYFEGAIHETLPPATTKLPITIKAQGKPKSHLVESGSTRNLRITRGEYLNGNRSPRLLFYYANELRDQGALKTAANIYKEYIEVSQFHDEKMRAYLYLARCLRYSLNHNEAEQVLWKALSLDGRFSELYVEMSYLYWDKGEYIKSKAFAQMAIRPIPKTSMFIEQEMYEKIPKELVSSIVT